MNSFTLMAVGNLARDPEQISKGETTYTLLRLMGNDYAGKDDAGNTRGVVTSVDFVAFDTVGAAIARYSRQGDQLVLQAQVRSNNWTDKHGKMHFDHTFVVQDFRFGAPGKVKRKEISARAAEENSAPLQP